MDILKYGEYEGTAELDMDRRVCRGKILFIDDLVTYEAASPADLQKEFQAAVDDYVQTCAALGRKPQKPLKGLFQVRVPPALHKSVVLRAMADNVTQNDVTVRALEAFVSAKLDVNHNVQVTRNVPAESLKTMMSSASAPEQWDIALAKPQKGPHLMSTIEAAAAPAAPIPVESPVSTNELTSILIKHYGLHEGRYDLLIEYQIGVGPVGPDPTKLVPGVMFGIGRIGLLAAKGDGPTSVDASVVNPTPVKKKTVAVATPRAQRKKPAA